MQRNTLQRQIILDVLKKLKTHPTVEDIYAEIQKEYPSISKTTVYRNLRQLAKNKLIRAVSLQDGLERYDSHAEMHYHCRCKNCGKIFDVEIEYVPGIDELVHKKYGFQVDEHDIVFMGTCTECGKKRKVRQ
ncbi:MAG: transcriptional repressor [Treponema sp.]|nr:transcriptional repressor [Treponema sp.]